MTDSMKPLGAWMITKCYASNNGSGPLNLATEEEQAWEISLRYKCEHPNISIIDEGLPVSDRESRVTYRNVYCARCNSVNETSLYRWEAEIYCESNGDKLFNIESKKKLFDVLTSEMGFNRTGCYLSYISRVNNVWHDCRFSDGPIIESCNETGQWPLKSYKAEIDIACTMYTSLFMKKYKNLFCFLCNTNLSYSMEQLIEDTRDKNQAHVARLRFSALIDFAETDDNEEQENVEIGTDCTENQIYDNITCSCIDVKCSEGKSFDSAENTCHSITKSKTIGYEACVKVAIETYGPTLVSDMTRFLQISRYTQLASFKQILTITNWCPGEKEIILHLKLYEINSQSFKSLESMEESLELNTPRFCEGLWYGALGQLVSCTINFVDTCPDNKHFSSPCEEQPFIRLKQLVDFRSLFEEEDVHHYSSFIKYRRTSRCAFIEISTDEFEESETMLMHVISGQSIARSKVDFVSNYSLIRLCIDDFIQWNQNTTKDICRIRTKKDTSFDTWTTSGIISLTTSCISLLLLFLTFVTYALFGQLRGGGGKSIMVLLVTLFVAQALYEFAIEQYEMKTLCSIFGILVHYFWLASIFSMNACTIERFYKLCYPLISRSFFMTQKPFIIATAYTFLFPCIIVAFNIAVNLSLNNGIGYGNAKLCYINNNYSRIFSFAVPMGALVVLNIALLICTIAKLRWTSIPGEKNSSQSKIGLVACVRLSVVTGFTWLIFFISGSISSPVLNYIFTAFLGLQGVDFFFSLVLNQKVLSLYKALLSKKLTTSSGYGRGIWAESKTEQPKENRNDSKSTSLSHLTSVGGDVGGSCDTLAR